MFKKLIVVFVASVVLYAFVNVACSLDLDRIVYKMGGQFVSETSETKTFWFPKDKQMITFAAWDTWYGQDGRPLYSVEHGVCTPIYGECPK